MEGLLKLVLDPAPVLPASGGPKKGLGTRDAGAPVTVAQKSSLNASLLVPPCSVLFSPGFIGHIILTCFVFAYHFCNCFLLLKILEIAGILKHTYNPRIPVIKASEV